MVLNAIFPNTRAPSVDLLQNFEKRTQENAIQGDLPRYGDYHKVIIGKLQIDIMMQVFEKEKIYIDSDSEFKMKKNDHNFQNVQ